MFDTREWILDQLGTGEEGQAEFMPLRFDDQGEISTDVEELAGELVGFANAEGGVIFLGVDDSGVAHGIPPEELDAVERRLLTVATDNCDPPVRLVVRKALLPGDKESDRRILLAHVLCGLDVHRTSGGRYYTRGESTKRDLTRRELARLFQQRGRAYVFDKQPVFAAAVEDLNRNRLYADNRFMPTLRPKSLTDWVASVGLSA